MNGKESTLLLLIIRHIARRYSLSSCDSRLVHFLRKQKKQPPRGVIRKRCSENMQPIYTRKPRPKCDFNKIPCNFIGITLRHEFSFCKFAAYFQNTFCKNIYGEQFLKKVWKYYFITLYFYDTYTYGILCYNSLLRIFMKPFCNMLLCYTHTCRQTCVYM